MNPNIINWRNLQNLLEEKGIIIGTLDDKIATILFKDLSTNQTLYEEKFEPNVIQIADIDKNSYKLSYKIHNGELEKLHFEIDDDIISFNNSESELSLFIKHPRTLNTVVCSKL